MSGFWNYGTDSERMGSVYVRRFNYSAGPPPLPIVHLKNVGFRKVDFTYILGPTGVGKTTLAQVITFSLQRLLRVLSTIGSVVKKSTRCRRKSKAQTVR
ncbi:MAG: hypothetical protein IPN49_15475 [Saprospiraceae bacterium]|nr:hypothetical protein [Saprospiraceae bacterium]